MRRLRKMLMLLCVHVTRVLFLVRQENLPQLSTSIGVTRSYSGHPFLCALGRRYMYKSLSKRKTEIYYSAGDVHKWYNHIILRAHKSRRLEQEHVHVTPIEAHSLIKIIELY